MKLLKIGIGLIVLLILGACAHVESNANLSSSHKEARVLKLAHNMNESHPIHQALMTFVESVTEKTNGEITFEILPNGVLGSETEVVEQVQNGSVDITKVSAGALESFSEEYSVFSLPFIFTSDTHYRNVMESDVVDDIYFSTEEKGFVGLSYFDSGARSFYTIDKPVETPEDLSGLSFRVMDSRTAIDMTNIFGGTPTPLSYNEIYTALQQGMIDGAESNPTALTNGKHGEVAKYFSYTEHTNIPDIIVMNSDVWNSLSDEEKPIIKEAASEAREEHTQLWEQAIEEAVHEAEEMGVTFNEVDKEPFIELVQPMHEKAMKNEEVTTIINNIKALDNDENA
ncbi:TRAP transporter substrate-binding protein [Gracilibacillus sp. S3-1-1]|uniref:TRAP transporter substrate-binding protein n=1 Tax=Gracilibacillus pellucidus TaxID=3095368 RepID=A0ACC6M0Q3_9BACI|nr:TRAP transporter substrate-binding protein [Gracilibacillus sp. S3-1-1]MDX8044533.1 TRAP transporter substrate-binding protein [Gracilibacillus sp. S3-1-1]